MLCWKCDGEVEGGDEFFGTKADTKTRLKEETKTDMKMGEEEDLKGEAKTDMKMGKEETNEETEG
jgi:hypothetical protein